MKQRTIKSTITFDHCFRLGDLDEIFPAGSYEMETDEDLLEGLSFQAFRRTVSRIFIPVRSGGQGLLRTVTIDPHAVDTALRRDAASTVASRHRGPVVPKRSKIRSGQVAYETDSDRQALDRADDEGMALDQQTGQRNNVNKD